MFSVYIVCAGFLMGFVAKVVCVNPKSPTTTEKATVYRLFTPLIWIADRSNSVAKFYEWQISFVL